jgi:hypothetical protein
LNSHSYDLPTRVFPPTAEAILNAIPSLVDQVMGLLQQREAPGPVAPLQESAEQRRRAVERSLAMALGTLTLPGMGGGTGGSAGLRAVADRDHTTESERGTGASGPDGLRQRLFEAVVGETQTSAEELETLSRRTLWALLPEWVRPIVLAAGRPIPRALPLNTLWGALEHASCGLIPDPGPDTERALPTMLEGHCAVIGPSVPLADVGVAVRWTHSLLNLGQDLPGRKGGVIHVEDHLTTLLLMQDNRLSSVLAERWTKRMDGMPAQRRERISTTLLAWLQEGGARQAARVLNVHPQTVRYRIRQAEGAFGEALYDGRSRLEIELALNYQRLVGRSDRPRGHGRTFAGRAAGATVPGERVNGI